MYPTPHADGVLNLYTFKSKEGIILNDRFTYPQKVIMECILARKSPTKEATKRIHVMAHTRYGKSIAIGAAVAVRASAKREPWAIVAGGKDQAQIIMDYVIQFSVNDPIMQGLLVNEQEIKLERLTQRRRRNHLTYKKGGEVRAYGAGKDGNAVMGQGCANVIEDESALINDSSQAKIFRMLGDHPDNFYMKVGNPFHNNHFKKAYQDKKYFHLNIDFKHGIKDGRVTEEYIEECRHNPHFDILYKNQFPDEELRDEKGYLPLFTHKLIENAQVEKEDVKAWGLTKDGCDPADSGQNEAVIVRRWQNVAEVIFSSANTDPIQFATEVATRNFEVAESIVDKVGVGSGTYNLLNKQMGVKGKLQGINSGEGLPDSIPLEERTQFYNLRAYIFWQIKLWLEQGNKLIKHKNWKQLLAIKYRTTDKGKIQIMKKEDIYKEEKIDDLGIADALSFTFVPAKPRMLNKKVIGGVKPINSKLGF